jgi:hypothetical protein
LGTYFFASEKTPSFLLGVEREMSLPSSSQRSRHETTPRQLSPRHLSSQRIASAEAWDHRECRRPRLTSSGCLSVSPSFFFRNNLVNRQGSTCRVHWRMFLTFLQFDSRKPMMSSKGSLVSPAQSLITSPSCSVASNH